MSVEIREEVREAVERANGGALVPWQRQLLDLDPSTLQRLHAFRSTFIAEGPLSEKLRHLIYAAVDSSLTQLLPKAAGAHGIIAMEHGATIEEVLDTFAIATVVCSRGVTFGLPIVLEELAAAGRPVATADEARVAATRRSLEEAFGPLPGWAEAELHLAPEALAARFEYGGGSRSERGLDERSRELIFVAVAACPAIADAEQTRDHVRRAIQAGATADELIYTLRAANGMALHCTYYSAMEVHETLHAAP